MARRRGKFVFVERRVARPEISAGPFSLDAPIRGAEVPAVAAGASEFVLEPQDPPMLPRDEIIYLLHTAAEIEHSLMAQYLYSAYSLPKTGDQANWRRRLIQIAKEEMGHLMAVQNILTAIGGVLNFDREDYPFNEFYPFPFKLEPFSVSAVARYVLAEMPDPHTIPQELDFNLAEVRKDAGIGPGDDMVNRVGSLFKLLIKLIKQADESILIAAPDTYQGDPGTWRAAVNGLVLSKVTTLPEALKLVEEVAEQGEGVTLPTTGDKSHFEDLYGIYKAAKAAGDPHALPVPVNPTLDDDEAEGYISHPEARLWADVFNHRFRWTLASIGSHLFLPAGSDRSALSQWSFQDMFLLSDIAEHLLSLPLNKAGSKDVHGRSMVAAPPFELPYTHSLPDRARLIWLHQKMMLDHSIAQMRRVTEPNFVSLQIGLLDEERANFIDQVLNQVS